VSDLYTKDGRPLRVSGDDVFDQSGRHVGRISGDRIFDQSGRYAATIVDGRAVYRSTESASAGSVYAPRAGVGSASAHRAGSAMWGEEPFRR
jgi:hypothetical protein